MKQKGKSKCIEKYIVEKNLIMMFIVEERCNGLKGEVIWDDVLSTYRLAGLGSDYTIEDADEWEVIGNAIEHPELLSENME